MECPNCHQQVPDTANVCGHCGQRLKVAAPAMIVCPNCKTQNRPDVRFCEQCGTLLNGAAVPAKRSPPSVPPLQPAIPASSPVQLADKPDRRKKWISALFWGLSLTIIEATRASVMTGVYRIVHQFGFVITFQEILEYIYGAFIMVGIPCAIAGYLMAGKRNLQRWAIAGLLFLYVPFSVGKIVFYLGDSPISDFVFSWGEYAGFGPLIAVLLGILVRKVFVRAK